MDVKNWNRQEMQTQQTGFDYILRDLCLEGALLRYLHPTPGSTRGESLEEMIVPDINTEDAKLESRKRRGKDLVLWIIENQRPHVSPISLLNEIGAQKESSGCLQRPHALQKRCDVLPSWYLPYQVLSTHHAH